MLYTTRNPEDAKKFVDSLPITEQEKEELKQFFPVMTEFMKEIKEKKGLNSKGGERWFSERLVSKINESEQILARFFGGFSENPVGNATKFLMVQSVVTAEIIIIGKNCGVSNQTVLGLEKYCEFMNSLVNKYSGIDDIIGDNDDNSRMNPV